jgi:hypothetical protein
MKVMASIQNADVDAAMKQEKVDAENARTAVEMATNISSHHLDIRKHDHEVKQSGKESKNAIDKR